MGEEGPVEAEPEKKPFKHKHTVGQDIDNVEEVLSRNRRIAEPFVITKCEREAARNWDIFYKNHEDRFFKNKNWTDREFKELTGKKDDSVAMVNDQMLGTNLAGSNQAVLLEVGCGPGNMLYPIIESNATIKAHCCDFSPRAIDLVKVIFGLDISVAMHQYFQLIPPHLLPLLQRHPLFDEERISPFVFDLVKNEPDLPTLVVTHPFGRPSIVSLIFVLSAIPPQHHSDIFALLVRTLPLGGTLCFRDFAHGDLCQVRFHSKASAAWAAPSLLSDRQDYYRRGDNTFSYFFTQKEITEYATSVGLEGQVSILETHGQNRKTGVQLHRRFIQGLWKKVR